MYSGPGWLVQDPTEEGVPDRCRDSHSGIRLRSPAPDPEPHLPLQAGAPRTPITRSLLHFFQEAELAPRDGAVLAALTQSHP